MFILCNITNILVSIWTDDNLIFIYYEHYQIQMTFIILIYYYSDTRISAFVLDNTTVDI
jgi:hypothetical protein